MKYYNVILFLIPFCSFSQDYSFSSLNISGSLTSSSLTVDNILVNEVSIGLNSDPISLHYQMEQFPLKTRSKLLQMRELKITLNLWGLH